MKKIISMITVGLVLSTFQPKPSQAVIGIMTLNPIIGVGLASLAIGGGVYAADRTEANCLDTDCDTKVANRTAMIEYLVGFIAGIILLDSNSNAQTFQFATIPQKLADQISLNKNELDAYNNPVNLAKVNAFGATVLAQIAQKKSEGMSDDDAEALGETEWTQQAQLNLKGDALKAFGKVRVALHDAYQTASTQNSTN